MSLKVTAICLQFMLTGTFLLLWLGSFSQKTKQPQPTEQPFPQADQLLKENQKNLGNNVVALVWKDGKMIYEKQLEKEVGDFNAKTQVPIGSCSQWMTAALVMTFVDEGKLSLDDKVSKFIPIFA
ncbi:MAG TPA: serine hydrolase domain-containing protein, partial [Puia sp.]|nr:serine hydrolase domain-containing protein [Puia sp.]